MLSCTALKRGIHHGASSLHSPIAKCQKHRCQVLSSTDINSDILTLYAIWKRLTFVLVCSGELWANQLADGGGDFPAVSARPGSSFCNLHKLWVQLPGERVAGCTLLDLARLLFEAKCCCDQCTVQKRPYIQRGNATTVIAPQHTANVGGVDTKPLSGRHVRWLSAWHVSTRTPVL